MSAASPKTKIREPEAISPEAVVPPEYTAKHRFARLTARKAGLIADLIRGRNVNEAIELLQFTPNRGAAFYLKVVKSAVANASIDENVNVNRLFVSEVRADIGPLLNDRLRFRPGPQGRAMPFAKRLSHLTVKVREREQTEEEAKASMRRGSKVRGRGVKETAAAADAGAPEKKAATGKPKKNQGGEKPSPRKGKDKRA